MDQLLPARPASAPRPLRRPLTEFVLPPSDEPGKVPPVAAPSRQPASATRRTSPPAKADDDERCEAASESLNEDRTATADNAMEATGPGDAEFEDNALFRQFEDMTSAAADAAKDYRSWMLEYMKVNMAAALNCANGIAGVNCRVSAAAHPDVSEPRENVQSQSNEKTTPAATSISDDYRTRAFELMTANINSTLEYAQRLAHAKTPGELIALSTSHAREHIESIMRQTTELGSMAQRLAAPNIASMAADFAKAFGKRGE